MSNGAYRKVGSWRLASSPVTVIRDAQLIKARSRPSPISAIPRDKPTDRMGLFTDHNVGEAGYSGPLLDLLTGMNSHDVTIKRDCSRPQEWNVFVNNRSTQISSSGTPCGVHNNNFRSPYILRSDSFYKVAIRWIGAVASTTNCTHYKKMNECD